MTAPTQIRLRAICAHHGVACPSSAGPFAHVALDALDRRAGIGTRGGTRPYDPLLPRGTPVNTVGERIRKHEAHIARQELALHARHYFHLGALAETAGAEG